MKAYTPAQKTKLKEFIRKQDTSLTAEQLATKLNEGGFTDRNNDAFVANTAQYARLAIAGVRKVVKSTSPKYARKSGPKGNGADKPKPSHDDNIALQDLVLDARISDAQKVKLLIELRKQ